MLGLLSKLLVMIVLNLFTSVKIGCLNPGLNFINGNTYVFPHSTVSDQTDGRWCFALEWEISPWRSRTMNSGICLKLVSPDKGNFICEFIVIYLQKKEIVPAVNTGFHVSVCYFSLRVQIVVWQRKKKMILSKYWTQWCLRDIFWTFIASFGRNLARARFHSTWRGYWFEHKCKSFGS